MVGWIVISVLVFGSWVSPLYPQSLADLARQERERQQKTQAAGKTSDKVLTERDLRSAGGQVTQNRRPPDGTKPGSGPAEAGPEKPAAAGGVRDMKGNDEAYWRRSKRTLQEELARAEKKLKEIDEFLARNHTTFTLSSLAPVRDERDRLAREVEEVRQKFQFLEEEARKAGAPAAWLR